MFRASFAHLQEVNDVNYTCMQSLVFSFSAGGRLVHLLGGDCNLYKKLCIKLVSIKERVSVFRRYLSLPRTSHGTTALSGPESPQ
jgi:hypothetical protein